MIQMVMSVLGKKSVLYVAAGAVVLVTGAFLYGYMKGYGKAEAKAQDRIAQALADERERLLAVAAEDLELAVRASNRERDIREVIREIPVPGDCTSAEWLQSYNAAIRAANTDGAAESP